MSSALGVLKLPVVDVESHLDQVNNVVVFGVSSGGYCRHDVLDDTKEGVLLSISGGFLDPVGFEMIGEAPVQSGVILSVRGVLGLGRPSRRRVAAIFPHV